VAERWEPERVLRDSYPGPGFDLPVMFGDLDPNRHVNNVAMGRYFEQARVLTNGRLRDSGGWPERSSFVIARVAVDYLAETHFGTPLHVRVRVHAVGHSSVTQQQAAWQGGVCVALAEAVLVHRSGGGPSPLPEPMRAAFAARLLGPS